jgi:hypothetical protein
MEPKVSEAFGWNFDERDRVCIAFDNESLPTIWRVASVCSNVNTLVAALTNDSRIFPTLGWTSDRQIEFCSKREDRKRN